MHPYRTHTCGDLRLSSAGSTVRLSGWLNGLRDLGRILFLELACIRWFASTVRYLTFFTNLVLLACFLGMSVGLMSARRGGHFVRAVFPVALVAVTLAVAAASRSAISPRT